MKIISKNPEWFSGSEGQQHFEKCKGLDEKSMFMYSYLKAICDSNNTKYDHTPLFKIAFLLSDAVLSSELSYAKLPDFLDVQKNPFLAYVKNTSVIKENEDAKRLIYASLLSILHGIADPFSKNDWLYDKKMIDKDPLKEKLDELGHEFIYSPVVLLNPQDYEIESTNNFIQLEILWLFGEFEFKYFNQ